MNYFFSILLSAIFCVSASAQTIRTLGYNATNGHVVYNGTNSLTFTNELNANVIIATNISADEVGAKLLGKVQIVDGASTNGFTFENQTDVPYVRANLGFSTNLNTLWTATNTTNARTGLGFSTNLTSYWTATNASNARSAIGLGTSNDVNFNMVTARLSGAADSSYQLLDSETDTNAMNYNSIEGWFVSAPSNFRVGIGLPLDALTNTSNVAAIRALAGSTNTNEPYSGTVALTNTNVLTFSNGVLLKIQ